MAEAARAAGYKLGFTGESKAATPTTDPRLIGRIGPTVRSPSRAMLQLALGLLVAAHLISVVEGAGKWIPVS